MVWEPLNLTQVCPAHTQQTACSPFGYVLLNFITQLFGDSVDRRVQESLRKLDNGDSENCNQNYTCYGDGYTESYERERDDYDFIVVGAGAAGCVVTNRLVENNYKVLLLEAGDEQPDITLVPGLSTSFLGSNIDWQYYTAPNGKSCLGREGQRCSWPRGKTMGGSSSINSMSYYVSHLPYIDRPSFMMTKAFTERGIPLADFNGANQFATMQGQTFTLHGERISANYAYIQPIRYKRKNLTVKVKSEVTKVLIDENKRAYGVIYEKNGRRYTAVAKNEVIVSGGAINSPKLLMLSGIGPKSHLESLGIHSIANLDVGYNLHDHVTFNGYAIHLPKGNSTLVDEKTIINDILDYKLGKVKNGPISGNGAVNSIAFIKTEPYLPAEDIQYQCYNVILKEYLSNPALYESISTYPTPYYDAIVPRTMNVAPESRGRLYLNKTNPNGYPYIYPNYLDKKEDFVPIIKGVKFLLSLENTKAFKDMGAYFSREKLPGCKEYEWGSDEYTVCLTRTYTSSPYHPVGTCKMGPVGDKTAVVDPRLRVYGVANLRVIDASIMPVVYERAIYYDRRKRG
ncbi:putative alcohol dehydrogenase, partial [Operophtera brumata]